MATNRAHVEGRKLRVAVASTVVSGDPVVIGEMAGVALTDYDAGDGKASIDFAGVWLLSVKGVNNAGNVAVAVGDPIFFVSGDTPKLSKKSSGVFFGYALEVVSSGATTTIKVRIPHSGGGRSASGFYGAGVYASAERTATGSEESIAHGLGSTPSHVFIVLTEFASGLNVDVAEGTHTSTNVLVTITSGVKYKVLAFK